MRLLTLNIERSAHLNRVIPFIREYAFDVVCLQELVETDIDAIRSTTGLEHCHFAAMARFSPDHAAPFGVAILSRHAFRSTDTVLYAGGGDGTMVIDRGSPESRLASMRYAAARVHIAAGDFDAQVATTHFPWTEAGQPSDFQFEAAGALINAMGSEPLLLCGDFNAPRGGPVFDRLARHWTDCVPAGVSTSIDPKLHRAGALNLMVDGVFASPGVAVSDVCLHTGLSDHQGITATVRQTGRSA